MALTGGLMLYASSAWPSNLPREVAGWYNDGWNAESHARYMANDHIFSETNPYWYDLGVSSNLGATNGSIAERGYAYDPQDVIDAHANGDLVVPAIADHVKGQIDAVVSNATAKQRLIDEIVRTVTARSFDGIDLNFEGGTPKARDRFTTFIGELATALHARGKRLEVTVEPAASAAEESALIFDYAALGRSAVDRIKIMAYDKNFDAGANVPGPIAPIQWVRSVLKYALSTRRIPASKILLGLHNYGWTWRKSGAKWQLLTPHDTFQSVQQKSSGTPWQWDATALESWKQYTYGGATYRSYVGTADTTSARIGLADEFGLAGIAFWVLGREDSAVYDRLCARYGAACTPSVHPKLLSRGKPTSASSSFDRVYTPAKAVDGNESIGWLANPAERTAWLMVDLQATYGISAVRILWGDVDWSTAYDVEVSRDGTSWTRIHHTTTNLDGGLDVITFGSVSGRFVRLRCTGPKSDNWSYEVDELEVYGRTP